MKSTKQQHAQVFTILDAMKNDRNMAYATAVGVVTDSIYEDAQKKIDVMTSGVTEQDK